MGITRALFVIKRLRTHLEKKAVEAPNSNVRKMCAEDVSALDFFLGVVEQRCSCDEDKSPHIGCLVHGLPVARNALHQRNALINQIEALAVEEGSQAILELIAQDRSERLVRRG